MLKENWILHLQVTAMKFFIGSKKDEEGGEGTDSEDISDDEEDDTKTIKEVSLYLYYTVLTLITKEPSWSIVLYRSFTYVAKEPLLIYHLLQAILNNCSLVPK